MRYLIAFVGLCLCLAGSAYADTVTITAPWTQVRRAPTMDGRAVDVVYGNDQFTVLESKDGWAKIRTQRKVTGWVLLNDAELKAGDAAPVNAQPAPAGEKKADAAPAPGAPTAPAPKNLQATTLSNATALAKLGYRDQAREKFTDLIQRNPGSVEAYESARQLLTFYPVGYLPPLKGGEITAEGKASLATVLPAVLLQEGIALQSEKQFPRSSRVYSFLLERDPANGRAFLGLMDTLQSQMAVALKANQQADLEAAAAAYRQHFPAMPLPDDVQKRLDPSKKS
jgi:tetratricopeptide (TPR) repeat protein